MSSSPFQITGVASGIGWDDIIDEMLTQASKPKEQWQQQIDRLELKKSLYQEVQSSIFSLRSTMTALKLPSAYKKKTAEFTIRSAASGNVQNADGIIKATVNANAEIAQWDIDVRQLAEAQRHVSAQFSPGEALGIEGKIRFQVGVQVAELEIKSDDSIRTINQKINAMTAADGGSMAVSAMLIDNRLVISGALTGRGTDGPLAETMISMADALTNKDGKKVSYLPHFATFADDDPDKVAASFPPQIYSLRSGSTTYRQDVDFKYDSTNGTITWLADAGSRTPKDTDDLTVVFEANLNLDTAPSTDPALIGKALTWADGTTSVKAGVAGMTAMPALSTGKLYEDLPGGASVDPAKLGDKYTLYDDAGHKLTYGTDFDFAYDADTNTQYIVWLDAAKMPAGGKTFKLRAGADNAYYVSHRQLHLLEDDMTSNDSVLYKLGLTDITHDGGVEKWSYNNVTYARDARLTVNGVDVTRSTNTIPVEDDESDALIANVKLELTGIGHVVMNITQDASEIIENLEKFVDSYNTLMELINYRLEETADKTPSSSSDTLSSILEDSKGNTSFGLLHGDSLLWSVKDQMRRYFSDPITTVSNDLRTKKYLWPAAALELTGSFYINVGSMQTRIDVKRTDSLEDIQRMLNNATAQNGTTGGSSASGRELGLQAEIVDGQLIVRRDPKFNGSATETHTIQRAADADYDQLAFVPYSASPVNGVLTVTSGSRTYTEGTDFEIQNITNDKGVIESRLVWTSQSNKPTPGSSYNVRYEYDAAGVGMTMIPNTGDLSTLDLHYDSSSIQLSSYGLKTTSEDYGKSGYIEFDSDKFFEAISTDSDMVSNVMLAFMDKMDTYIGNLVDSTNQIVGGNIITKGRFASAINRIDSEVSDLQERITNLERQLEDKQNALYKQYSDMEIAIQKMNAQMSSIAQYLNNMSSGGGGQQQ